jgi:hypothetical protein
MARLVVDRSEHAGVLARSKEVILALDSQHGIYRERVSAVTVSPGEGPLTEPTAAAQPGQRELVFAPLTRHRRMFDFVRTLGSSEGSVQPADRP